MAHRQFGHLRFGSIANFLLITLIICSVACNDDQAQRARVSPAALSVRTSDCGEFAKVGWYNTEEIKSSYQQWHEFFLYVRSEQDFERAKSTAASFRIPLLELMQEFGFNFSESDYQKFRKLDILTARQRLQTSQSLERWTKTVSPDVTRLIETCLNQPGLHAWLKGADRPEGPVLQLKYIAISRHPTASVTADSSPVVSCKPGPHTVAPLQVFSVPCPRKSEFDGGYVIVNSELLFAGGYLFVPERLRATDLPPQPTRVSELHHTWAGTRVTTRMEWSPTPGKMTFITGLIGQPPSTRGGHFKYDSPDGQVWSAAAKLKQDGSGWCFITHAGRPSAASAPPGCGPNDGIVYKSPEGSQKSAKPVVVDNTPMFEIQP